MSTRPPSDASSAASSPSPAGEARAEAGEPELILGRYGELWLKGKNRHLFEKTLMENVRHALASITPVTIERAHGNLVVVPETRAGDAARRMQDVFGLASLSPAWGAPSEPDAIARVAAGVLDRAMDELPRNRTISFRVATKRADKEFPMISTELDRYVADRVVEPHEKRLRIDLTNAELSLGILVRRGRSFVFADRLRGAGGLPVGSLGKVLALFSGGIDSPVAAWMAMKRGCDVGFVSFTSYPYVGETAVLKIKRLVRALGRFQRRSLLYTVPFTHVQTAIKDECPESYRTVLYRRMMQRIAEAIARRDGSQAVVTGDSLGQVASQTLENLACIRSVATLPTFSPLLGFDKSETIARAREIGTFEISIVPEPDCCTVFQPERPVTHGRIERCEEAESRLDVDGLVAAALEGAERLVL